MIGGGVCDIDGTFRNRSAFFLYMKREWKCMIAEGIYDGIGNAVAERFCC